MAETTNSKAIQITDTDEVKRLAQQLTDEVKLAAGNAETYWNTIIKNRELYKESQPRQSKPWDGACELVIPYAKQAKLALMSHVVPTLLGSDPVYHVEAINRDSKLTADDLEDFLQAQLSQQVKFRRVMERAFDAALRDGTAILHVYWWTEKRQVPRYTGKTARAASLKETTVYDAPKISLVPVERFGTFPVANVDIQESPGVFIRQSMTGDEILQHAASANFPFDTDAVEKLRTLDGDASITENASSTQRSINNSAGDIPFGSRSYQITRVYYRYTRPEGDDPAQDWLITLHEDSGTILQAIPSPWFHQQRPFIALSPYQDVEGFYGDSLASSGAGQIQTAMTTLFRLAVDAMAIGISPELLVAGSLGQDIAKLKQRRGPGGVIPMPDAYFENNSTKMQPFGSNGYQPSAVIPLLQVLDRNGQQSTGANDTTKGVPNAGNVTATEAQQIMESSQKIIAFLTERLAAGMDELGEMLHALNYQFQGNEGPKTLWTLLHQGQDDAPHLYDALEGHYTISAGGVRDTSNRAIRAKRAMERVQLLMQEPLVVQNPERRYNLLYDALLQSGTNDPSRYLGNIDEWKMAQGMLPGQPGAQTGQPALGQPMPPQGAPQPPQGQGAEIDAVITQVAQQLGIAPEQLTQMVAQGVQQTGQPPEAVLQMIIQQAQQEQQGPNGGTLLDQVANVLQISPEQLQAQIEQLAQQQGRSPEEVLQAMAQQIAQVQGGQGNA